MKKNIYLTIIWGITILAIIFGTFYHSTNWGEKFFDKLGIKIPSHTQYFDETLNIFDKISFDVDLSGIEIITGNDYHISYECTENLIPEYEVKDGTLQVTQTSRNPHFPKRNGNDNCEIIITVPKDVSLSDITGYCDLGDVELNNLTADNISITCDLGAAALSNVSAASISCDCNLGSCEIDDCYFDNLTINNDLGSVDVNGNISLSDYTMKLSASMGGIAVNGNDYLSSYEQIGDKDKTITISCDMGSIEIADTK